MSVTIVEGGQFIILGTTFIKFSISTKILTVPSVVWEEIVKVNVLGGWSIPYQNKDAVLIL